MQYSHPSPYCTKTLCHVCIFDPFCTENAECFILISLEYAETYMDEIFLSTKARCFLILKRFW